MSKVDIDDIKKSIDSFERVEDIRSIIIIGENDGTKHIRFVETDNG